MSGLDFYTFKNDFELNPIPINPYVIRTIFLNQYMNTHGYLIIKVLKLLFNYDIEIT